MHGDCLMRKTIAALLAATAGLNPAFALAATVSVQAGGSAQAGGVFVNSGQGFVAVPQSTEVGPGAMVLVRGNGAAVISYGTSCSVRVGASRVWQVAATPPCLPGTSFIDLAGSIRYAGAHHAAEAGPWQAAVHPAPADAAAASAADAAAAEAAAAAAAAPTGISTGMLVVGGLMIAGGVGLALAASGGGSPASP